MTESAQDWPELAATWFMNDRTPRVIVDRDLRVLAVNRRAADVIAASDVLSISRGQLLAVAGPVDLRDALARASDGQAAQFLGEPDAGIMMTAMVVFDGASEPVALTLRDMSEPVAFDCPDLRSVFGLTQGEYSVILELLGGASSREIADQSGRSLYTVRTHLKRAYGKIGVRSHAQLFARLLPFLSVREASG